MSTSYGRLRMETVIGKLNHQLGNSLLSTSVQSKKVLMSHRPTFFWMIRLGGKLKAEAGIQPNDTLIGHKTIVLMVPC